MKVNRDACPFFSALASETRLRMVEMLGEGSLNISEMAQRLGVSSTIVAKHVKTLESANIISCRLLPGEHGQQKICRLVHSGLVLNFMRKTNYPEEMCFEVPVGSYVDWDVRPTCGLFLQTGALGKSDDARAFADPRRIEAGCLCVGHGYLEYAVPNYVGDNKRLVEIRIQLELCSEAPGYDLNWPSDIYFHINGLCIGCWTCPSDYGGKPGLYTPDWYARTFQSQYGELKQIVVNESGSFIDGTRVSDVTTQRIMAAGYREFRLRISSPEDTQNPRGFNLFGKRFGNYDQNILFTVVTADSSPA